LLGAVLYVESETGEERRKKTSQMHNRGKGGGHRSANATEKEEPRSENGKWETGEIRLLVDGVRRRKRGIVTGGGRENCRTRFGLYD